MNYRTTTFFFVFLFAFSLLSPTGAFAEKPAASAQLYTACLPFLAEAATASTSSPYVGTRVYVLSDPEAWLEVADMPERFFGAAAGAMKVDQARSLAPPTTTPEDAGVDYVATSRQSSSFAVAPDCPPAAVVNPYIGGRIYRDVNHNGALDAGVDFPVAGVLVSVYSDASLVGTTMSSADGDYLFESASMTNGTEYRVEFTGYPSYLETAVSAGGSNTSVQFVTPSVCSIDFGLIDPYEYVGPDPSLLVTCFVEGSNSGDGRATLLSMDFFNPANNSYVGEANGATIGTAYGLSYSTQSEQLFAGAYYKRFTGFGPGTTGSIYIVDNVTDGANSGSLFVDLNTLFGTNVAGDDEHDFVSTLAVNGQDLVLDTESFNLVGRRAFGDIDITSDGDTLWAVNLNDRSLYGIPLGNDPQNPVPPTAAADVEVVPVIGNLPGLPAGVSDNEIIPFGLKYYRGNLYLGVVTNGETNGLSTMFGLAYQYNLASGTFTKVLEFPLNYARGCGFNTGGLGCAGPADWNPWLSSNVLPAPPSVPSVGFSYDQAHPQPIFADIEFDAAGNMIIGLRDRYGDQSGARQLNPGGTPISNPNGILTSNLFEYNDAYGDMLLATPSGGGWAVNIADFTDNSLSTTGPGGGVCPDGEAFFGEDCFPSPDFLHEEVIMGGLAMLPQSNTVATTSVDPDNTDFANGVRWYNTMTGELEDELVIIRDFSFTGKANGLGDMELVSPPPPIEIGNRLWRDDDLDGIQDPGEAGINGVLVELYLETSPGMFTLVATTMTGASGTQGDGAYLFSTDGAAGQTWLVGTGVAAFSNYEVRLNLADVIAVETDIFAFTTSDANSDTSNDANTDLNDSDLVDNSGVGVISYTTGDNGFHNHTLDFGVSNSSLCQTPDIRAYAIQVSCTNDTPGSDGYIQISSTTGDRYALVEGGGFLADGGDPDYAMATDISTKTFPLVIDSMLTNPTGDRPYTIRIFNGSTECFLDTTIVLRNQDCTVGCNCQDYVYLNDEDEGLVHKFEVGTDPGSEGTLTEIGAPWLPPGLLDSPHGLAFDNNGFLYVGNAFNNFNPITKLTCDGEVVDATFIDDLPIELFNMGSKDGVMYIPDGFGTELYAYSLCTGELIGTMPIKDNAGFCETWGFFIQGDNWYAADRASGCIFTAPVDTSQFVPGTTARSTRLFCTGSVGTGTNGGLMGLTIDDNGNFYIIAEQALNGSSASLEIRKYSPTGVLLGTVGSDTDEGPNLNNGEADYFGSRGIVYSSTTGLLYLSNYENCITVFDTTLTQRPDLNIGNPTGGSPKGISLLPECCPTNNNVLVDTILCNVQPGDVVFLQELISCDGVICGGIWETGDDNSGLTYMSCDNSVIINSDGGCGSFTLKSDGLEEFPQCGAFVITLNIGVEMVEAAIIGGQQEVCPEQVPDTLRVISMATGTSELSFQWLLSTESDSTGFTTIPGAITENYAPSFDMLTADTTYFRLVSSVNGCTGMCSDTSNAVLVIIRKDCLSLGSTVFVDGNNDGFQGSDEPGIPGVLVIPYFEGGDGLTTGVDDSLVVTGADGIVGTPDDLFGPDGVPGTPDDGQAGVLTDSLGNYFFAELGAGDYYVEIPMAAFAADGPLENIPLSSNGTNGYTGETDPDDNRDNDDEGIQATSGATTVSQIITLSEDEEPLDTGMETAQGNGQDQDSIYLDRNGNMTLDFGFFAPVSLGDTTFVDSNENGLQGMGEPFLSGVTVTLFNSDGSPVTLDAEGNAYTNTTMTNGDGFYEFSNLPPGDYYVVFDLSTAPGGDFYIFTTNTGGDEANDSDADPTTGQTDNTGAIMSGDNYPDLDAGVVCNVIAEAGTGQTICSTVAVDLTSLGASITPTGVAGFGATWTSAGGGTFDDANVGRLGVATTYTPSPAEIQAGQVILTLTTDDPSMPPFNAATCGPVMDEVIITILRVDCGSFPWGGSN